MLPAGRGRLEGGARLRAHGHSGGPRGGCSGGPGGFPVSGGSRGTGRFPGRVGRRPAGARRHGRRVRRRRHGRRAGRKLRPGTPAPPPRRLPGNEGGGKGARAGTPRGGRALPTDTVAPKPSRRVATRLRTRVRARGSAPQSRTPSRNGPTTRLSCTLPARGPSPAYASSSRRHRFAERPGNPSSCFVVANARSPCAAALKHSR